MTNGLTTIGYLASADGAAGGRQGLDARSVALAAEQMEGAPPQEILRWAFERFSGERLALCTSFQADGMALLDMAWRINPRVRVFTVDTGRLPAETYELVDQVRAHFGIPVEVYLPEASEVESMVRANGVNLFYQSVPLRLTCCEVRKVRPLERVLGGLDAWITGLRRDQWRTRATIRAIELDREHGGIVKLNPLAGWTEGQVWDYLRAYNVPVHPLYAQGYTSIGCAPCTRTLAPGEDARAGRWWWETDAPKECGMHCAIELVGAQAGVAEAAR